MLPAESWIVHALGIALEAIRLFGMGGFSGAQSAAAQAVCTQDPGPARRRTGIIKSVRSLLPFLVCVALVGCHRNIQNEDAVKRGVMDYLATRRGLNISSMTVSIASMAFRHNVVDATVVFTPKGADGMRPMTIPYTLERSGDRWVVRPRSGGGQNPHGGMAMPERGVPDGPLPPGHPAVAPGSPQQ